MKKVLCLVAALILALASSSCQKIEARMQIKQANEAYQKEDYGAALVHYQQAKQIDPSFDVPLSYTCPCSRERALAPLALFSDGELREMMQEETTEVTCQFCGRRYRFSPDDLLGLTKVN